MRNWYGIALFIGMVALALWAAPARAASSVTPPQGPPGTTFTFTADSYRSRERIFVWVNTPTGQPQDLFVLVKANDAGVATWQWASSQYLAGGRWTMVAQGQDSRKITVIPLELAAAPAQPTAQPAQSATPVAGLPGTTFTITASGFFPTEQIDTWVNRPDGRPQDAPAYVFANDVGVATWQWVAATNALPGTWSVVGRGRASGYERVIRVQITN